MSAAVEPALYEDDDSTAADGDLAYNPNEPTSDLDRIAADVQADVAEPTRVRHPGAGMERYVLVFRSNIETAEAQSCEKRTKNSKKPIRDRNALFLAVTNVGIEYDGRPVENSNGRHVTFRDPEFMARLNAKTAAQCVVAMFRGNDGHVIGVADAVATAAGFGTDVEVVEDPTGSG